MSLLSRRTWLPGGLPRAGGAGFQRCHGGHLQPSPCSLQVKAEKSSRNLGRLQECSRNVNEMAANVVASTKSGQEQIEEKGEVFLKGKGREKTCAECLSGLANTPRCLPGFASAREGPLQGVRSARTPPPFPADTMDFSGMSLIKLKKEEMETQVRPWGWVRAAVPIRTCAGGSLLLPRGAGHGDSGGDRTPGRGAQDGSVGAGEGAGAGETSGGRAGAPGRAEEAALCPGRGLRRGGGRRGEAGAGSQARHPQEAPPGTEARPRGGRVPEWEGHGGAPFTAPVTDISLYPRSRFSPSETPARAPLPGPPSSCVPSHRLAFALACLRARASPHHLAWKTGIYNFF